MSRRDLERRLATFANALGRLRAALAQPKNEWTRDAAIQRFEFTFELAWKTLRHFATAEGLPTPASPRQALRAAAQLGWIPDAESWLGMLDDRNRTSHTYNEVPADEIYVRLGAHAVALQALNAALADHLARSM